MDVVGEVSWCNTLSVQGRLFGKQQLNLSNISANSPNLSPKLSEPASLKSRLTLLESNALASMQEKHHSVMGFCCNASCIS